MESVRKLLEIKIWNNMDVLVPFHWIAMHFPNLLFIDNDRVETTVIIRHGILKTVIPQL
jgi:hypothetical protein